MQNLSLLIFDEAHHVRKYHPANRIMRDFYHRIKVEDGEHSVPHILGLTASPTFGSTKRELDIVESSLHAITVTPREHQFELQQFVNYPALRVVEYSQQTSDSSPQVLNKLSVVCESKNATTDAALGTLNLYNSEQDREKKLFAQVNAFHSLNLIPS
jgi:ERCC4-related helicase